MKIHMNALAQMVRIRGGLEQLGLGGILHMFITRWLFRSIPRIFFELLTEYVDWISSYQL
jgi:hypothetical protein